MKVLNEKNRNTILFAAVVIFMYWISQNVQWGLELIADALDVLSPVLMGGAIAFVLYLPMNRYIKILSRIKGEFMERSRNFIAFLLSILSLAALLFLILWIVIPEMLNTFTLLTTAVPNTYDKIYKWVIENQESFPQLEEWLSGISIDWGDLFQRLFGFVTGGVAGVFDTTFNVVSVILGGLYSFMMSLIIAFYLLLNRRRLAVQTRKVLCAYLPERVYRWILKVGYLCQEAFSQYVVGKCLDALAVGVMCFAGMSLFGFPYAAMISVIIGVTAMIPIIGGYIGMAVGAMLLLVINPIQALWFVGFIVFLQIFEGNLIYPKIMGDTIGLPAMWIIIAITVGGGMFGFLGMLLSVPVASVLYALVKESVEKRLAARSIIILPEPERNCGAEEEKERRHERKKDKKQHHE